jgi:MOSC domain-containing protein YiiM
MILRGETLSVSVSQQHSFSKLRVAAIELVAGQGVSGDAHAGSTVKHRSRVAVDPSRPNLRQVHLLHAELFDELNVRGFRIGPGDMGENITTRGVALLRLPRRTQILFPSGAVIEITGLRNPCNQLDQFSPGLMNAVLERSQDGTLVRKTGVMAVVLKSGMVTVGDPFQVALPPEPHETLQCV